MCLPCSIYQVTNLINYSKHMDKHERPYVCKEAGCEKIKGFTYSGGLLRHQREVHKKHGGPKAPLMCPHSVCKRSTGTGFTRKENLVEHLRRVHQKPAADATSGLKLQRSAEDDDTDFGSPLPHTRKRKRSLTTSDSESYHPATVDMDASGDLRHEVKRLKQELDEKDRRLRDLEARFASFQQQVHRSPT